MRTTSYTSKPNGERLGRGGNGLRNAMPRRRRAGEVRTPIEAKRILRSAGSKVVNCTSVTPPIRIVAVYPVES
jgi:hypothetical protein